MDNRKPSGAEAQMQVTVERRDRVRAVLHKFCFARPADPWSFSPTTNLNDDEIDEVIAAANFEVTP